MKMKVTRHFDSVEEFKEAFEERTAKGSGWDLDYFRLGVEEREELDESIDRTYCSQMTINWNGLEFELGFGASVYNGMVAFLQDLLDEDYE